MATTADVLGVEVQIKDVPGFAKKYLSKDGKTYIEARPGKTWILRVTNKIDDNINIKVTIDEQFIGKPFFFDICVL